MLAYLSFSPLESTTERRKQIFKLCKVQAKVDYKKQYRDMIGFKTEETNKFNYPI